MAWTFENCGWDSSVSAASHYRLDSLEVKSQSERKFPLGADWS